MPLSATSIRSDLSEIVADLPCACSCKGTAFTATAGDYSLSRDVDVDGFGELADKVLVCDLATMPTAVGPDADLTVDGVAFRVMTVSKHQDGVGVELRLKAVDK